MFIMTLPGLERGERLTNMAVRWFQSKALLDLLLGTMGELQEQVAKEGGWTVGIGIYIMVTVTVHIVIVMSTFVVFLNIILSTIFLPFSRSFGRVGHILSVYIVS